VTNQPLIACKGISPRHLFFSVAAECIQSVILRDFQYGHSLYLSINELIMLTSLYKNFYFFQQLFEWQSLAWQLALLSFWATVTRNGFPSAVLSVCLSVTLVYCGQTVGLIKMPLGMEVSLGPGDTVLDWDQLPRKGTQQPPHFRPMSIVAKRSPISASAELLLSMEIF